MGGPMMEVGWPMGNTHGGNHPYHSVIRDTHEHGFDSWLEGGPSSRYTIIMMMRMMKMMMVIMMLMMIMMVNSL